MAFPVAILPPPGYLLIAGKSFGQEWVLAQSETGGLDDLSDYLAAEVLLERQGGGGFKTWTLANGHITIIDDVISLAVDEAETGGMAAGAWLGLLSLGAEAGEAEEPVLRFYVQVEEKPSA